MASLFQTRDAVDEKDFEMAIDVSLNCADMVIWKRRTGVIVNVCILEEFEQGTKAACAVP